MEEKIDKLVKWLEKLSQDGITIIQGGFLQNKFSVENFSFNIDNEILSIASKNSYLKMNINQIYNIEEKNDDIKIFLDNDTTITIKEKDR